jgi:hypothetical protein
MQNKKPPVDYVLAQSASVLRRVAVIRDYGFTFDAETSHLVDETIKMIEEAVLDIVKEVAGNYGEHMNTGPCSSIGTEYNNR